MDDKLRRSIEHQIRERLTTESVDTTTRIGEQFRARGLHERSDEIVHNSAKEQVRRVEADLARTLPFALEIAERDGVTDCLSDDQHDEAEMKAAQSSMNQALQRFESRPQNTSRMSSQRRGLAESFLTLAKTHAQMMSDRFMGNKNVTETDLEETAQVIANDLRKLANRTQD